jgi:thioredoxin 1
MERKQHRKIPVYITLVSIIFSLFVADSYGSEIIELPVEGMATMVDLGSTKCIPCKMMAPILEKMKKVYEGKAAVVFIDVWENPEQAKKFGIKVIPTQIFFDKDGNEVYRHAGFMSEEEIVYVFNGLGVN